MRDPEQAAHALGKLFKYCGENNVLWGTDSIWYGSPQDQIQAFRTFQISPELRAKHGYPEITPALRAKVFGLNATRPYPMSAAEVKKYTAARPHRARAARLPRAARSRTFGRTARRRGASSSTCSTATAASTREGGARRRLRRRAQSTTATTWISTSCSGSPSSSTAMLVVVGLWLNGAK